MKGIVNNMKTYRYASKACAYFITLMVMTTSCFAFNTELGMQKIQVASNSANINECGANCIDPALSCAKVCNKFKAKSNEKRNCYIDCGNEYYNCRKSCDRKTITKDNE